MISIPFSGSKRYSYKNVKAIVEQGDYDTVYEPFGGSCVLSVNLLNDGLVDRAVVNDFDHFFDDYETYLDLKDKVVEEGYKAGLKRTTGMGSKTKRFNTDGTFEIIDSETLSKEDKIKLQNIIKKYVPESFWRYFSLGSNFTHSAVSSHKEIKLSDFSKFNSCLKTDKQRNYIKALNQCEIENLDWKDFFDKHKPDSNSIIILDPPYINTAQGQYKGQFTKSDTLELINTVKNLDCDFVFFNHDLEVVEEILNGFDYVISHTGNTGSTANRSRKDVMAYVKNRGTSNEVSFLMPKK